MKTEKTQEIQLIISIFYGAHSKPSLLCCHWHWKLFKICPKISAWHLFLFSFYFRLCCVYLFAGNQGDQTLSIKHAAHHTVRDGIGTGTWIGIRFQIGELLARLLRFQHNGVSSVGGFDFKGRQGNPGTYIEICWDRGYGNPSVTLMRTFDKDETGEHTSKCYEISKRERGKMKEES